MKISLFSRGRGQTASFEELLAPHVEHMYRLAFRFTNTQHDAEDLVQDLLTKLYPRHDELLGIDHLRPWLARVLYRIFVDSRRAHARSPIDYGLDDLPEAYEQASGDDPAGNVNQSRLNMHLHRALGQLSEEHRVLILMHDVEDYTLAELSEILDAPLGTLKSRLHRGRAQLKNLLQEGTISLDAAC